MVQEDCSYQKGARRPPLTSVMRVFGGSMAGTHTRVVSQGVPCRDLRPTQTANAFKRSSAALDRTQFASALADGFTEWDSGMSTVRLPGPAAQSRTGSRRHGPNQAKMCFQIRWHVGSSIRLTTKSTNRTPLSIEQFDH